MRLGYFLSSEEHPAPELVRQARMAQDAGFEALWVSDHFHPWNDEQGQSPFVWSVIGAVSQVCDLPLTTAVTCPTVRTHPAVIAQAAATSATLMPGRFHLGVGSGEALNEHITGASWPSAQVRLEMLEEAVDIIRRLFTGERVYHRGRHYVVDEARLYSRPDKAPPIYVSGFGPRAIELAARIADGFISTNPQPDDLDHYRLHGGRGPAEAGVKVCWARDEESAVDTAHRLWANSGVPGELAQVLPSPKHFEQASSLVTRESTASSVACGPDPKRHAEVVRQFADAGYDTLYVSQMGPQQEEFFQFWADEVRPLLAG
jgi:G6PDH family F420-dependent oxidoreductase